MAVGYGLTLFAAGTTVGVLGTITGGLGIVVGLTGAVAAVVVVLVAGIGLVPLLAVRLGRLPLPMVSADPQVLADERRPAPAGLRAAVVRADQILAGCLAGLAAAGLGCMAALAAGDGLAAPLLAGLASFAILLRARLFPSVAARLPLVTAGALGLALTGRIAVAAAAGPVRAALLLAVGAVVAGLLATATLAPRRPVGVASPYLGRVAEILDIATAVALAPVACGVLGLYEVVRGLVS